MSGEKKHGLESNIGSGLNNKKKSDLISSDAFPVYAHIESLNHESAQIKSFFVHNRESPTKVNLKQALILLTKGKEHNHEESSEILENNSIEQEILENNKKVKVEQKDGRTVKQSTLTNNDFENRQSSILLPDIVNQWEIHRENSQEHSIVSSSFGWQNITLRSRIYNDAHSKLHLTFDLKLMEELHDDNDESQKFSAAQTIQEAIQLLGDDYLQKDYYEDSSQAHGQEQLNTHFIPEKTVCHDCRTLSALVQDYREFMTGNKAATVPAAIAYLKILERIRIAGPGTSKDDMINLLKQLESQKKHDLLSSVLDIMAGARSEASVTASLEFLGLSKNNDLETSERFLQSLAASCVTASTTSSFTDTADLSSHQFIVNELYRILDRKEEWESHKLKWTTFLTIASVSKSYAKRIRSLNSMKSVDSKKISDATQSGSSTSVVQLIIKELKSCAKDDVDCKLALLHALGNSGNLLDSLSILEDFALETKGKRESIAAMKAVRDCLEDPINQPLTNSSLIQRLRILSLKIVYDSSHESTSRIIAAEIIAKHLSDSVLSGQLLKAVPEFGKYFFLFSVGVVLVMTPLLLSLSILPVYRRGIHFCYDCHV